MTATHILRILYEIKDRVHQIEMGVQTLSISRGKKDALLRERVQLINRSLHLKKKLQKLINPNVLQVTYIIKTQSLEDQQPVIKTHIFPNLNQEELREYLKMVCIAKNLEVIFLEFKEIPALKIDLQLYNTNNNQQ